MRKLRFYLIAILCVLLYCSILTAQEKDKAPEFTLKSTEGEELNLYDFTGKVVILHFWKAN